MAYFPQPDSLALAPIQRISPAAIMPTLLYTLFASSTLRHSASLCLTHVQRNLAARKHDTALVARQVT